MAPRCGKRKAPVPAPLQKKQVVHFKTDSSPPVRVYCTPDGRIDYSALGFEFVLDPASIKLNGSRFPIEGLESQYTWEEIEEIFEKEGEPVGTKEDPVIVTGKPPVHGASTERGAIDLDNLDKRMCEIAEVVVENMAK